MSRKHDDQINRSSTFYGQTYYEKLRKKGDAPKKMYRQRNKELYDQQNQLEPVKIYKNHSGRCEMIQYYTNLVDPYFVLRAKRITGSDEFNQAANQYLATTRERIKDFHEHLMCDQFQLFEDWKKRIMAEKQGNSEYPTHCIQKCEMEIEEGFSGCRRRYDTCNQCPILIQQFEISIFEKLDNIPKHTSNWEKLNGKQKMTKFRCFVEQHLKILKFQLENKCEFVQRAMSQKNHIDHNEVSIDIECL